MHPEWIAFTERLPSRADADKRGYVMLREQNAGEREGMYDWIPPSTKDAPAWWRQNGFTHWRPLR